ncbi:MAG: hypothetical protein GYA02_12745 [Clostridiaceae bacterium]|jgi:hypothetical protein|nr:hypothetical protein [Clostridiaceae bacterium]
MIEESKDTNKTLSTEEIIKAHKRAIKLVSVNWKGNQLEIPVFYSFKAAITYERAYEETKDYRKSFCIMILKMIDSNKSFVYKEDEFPILELSDIDKLSNDDLIKIGNEVINSSEDLKKIKSEKSIKGDNFFEIFYAIHKTETEQYSEQIKKSLQKLELGYKKQFSTFLEATKKMTGIIETIKPVKVNAIEAYQNIVGNSALVETIAIASNIENSIGTHINIINPINESVSKSIYQMQSSLASISSMVNPAIQNVYSSIDSISDILLPINMDYLQRIIETQESVKRSLNINFQNNIKIFTEGIKGILGPELAGFKINELQQNLINNITPFILSAQKTLIARKNINNNLTNRAKIMFRYEWWLIDSLPISIINYIYDNGDDLTKQDVDDIICEYYKNNEYSGLERILKSWNELPYYATRRKQIRDAFYAHKLGLYSLSIPVLGMMLEGVIRDFMSDTYSLTHYKFSPLYNGFKKKAKELDEFILKYTFNCIDLFYIRYNPQNPDEVDDFSRHKMFHGQAINYDSEVNSLKLILYLDELFQIESYLRTA